VSFTVATGEAHGNVFVVQMTTVTGPSPGVAVPLTCTLLFPPASATPVMTTVGAVLSIV
jgi:hypothetical protein